MDSSIDAAAHLQRPDTATFERLTELGTRRRYPAGSLLMAEGDLGGTVLALTAGRVEVRISPGTVLASLGPGAVVGELAAVDGLPRSASVEAATEVDCVAISGPVFIETIAELRPDLLPLMTATVERTRAATEEATLRLGGVPLRAVARWLDERYQPQGTMDDSILALDPGDVAAETGLSSELVARALDHLAGIGALALERGRVLVLDAAALHLAATPR